MKSIADAEAKDAVDRGGKLGNRVQDQIASGNFAAARRTAGKIAENEARAAITGTGPNRDRRSMADIGSDYGLNQGSGESKASFSSRIKNARENGVYEDFSTLPPKKSGLEEMKAKGSLKDELAAKKTGVDKPGQEGEKPPAKGETAKKGLEGVAEKILELIQKIEPRLPVAALV